MPEPLKPAVTADSADAFLRGHLGASVTGLMPLAGGEWSQAFAYRHDGGDYVVRFSRLQEDFAKDRLAAGFAGPELPIPCIVDVGEAFDGFYAISERVFGEPLDGLTEARMRLVLPSLLSTLDAIRLVDTSGSTGFGGWDASGVAPYSNWRETMLAVATDWPGARISGWKAKLAASATGDRPFQEAFARLSALTERCPETRCLVHADLVNDNVLVSGDRIAGVLDWGSSIYGDFLYDLASLDFWRPWYPAWQAIDFAGEAARHHAAIGLEVPHFEERLRCCELYIGLEAQVYCAYLERWSFLAKIAQQTLAVARAT